MGISSMKQRNRKLILQVFKERCALNPAHRYEHIHEIIPKSKKKDWWVIGNQVPLCAKCHDKIHREGSKNYVDRLTVIVWDKLLNHLDFQKLIKLIVI